jgi:hypothetical protein
MRRVDGAGREGFGTGCRSDRWGGHEFLDAFELVVELQLFFLDSQKARLEASTDIFEDVDLR